MTFNNWLGGLIFAGLIFCAGCLVGSWYEARDAQQVAAEQLRKAFDQGQALGTVKEKVVTEYVYRDRVIKGRTQTLIKQVPVYVSEAADRACTVPAGFVRLHDAAAANLPAPGPRGAADAAPSGVALSAVAAVNAENYGTCNDTASRLSSLQEFIRGYQATTNNQAAK